MSEELEETPEYGYIVGSGDARQELRWRFIVALGASMSKNPRRELAAYCRTVVKSGEEALTGSSTLRLHLLASGVDVLRECLGDEDDSVETLTSVLMEAMPGEPGCWKAWDKTATGVEGARGVVSLLLRALLL